MFVSGCGEMSVGLREQGIYTLHDQVVSEVAQRWAKAFQCKVTIKTDLEQHRWADPRQQADIVGWYFTPRGHSMGWMADVETNDSLSDLHVSRKWAQAAVPGVPMYLLVPSGCKALAEQFAASKAICFTGIYEYRLYNGIVQIL